VADQGSVAVAGDDVTYGDVAVTGNGRRAMLVASLTGPSYYPSAVFGRLVPGEGVDGLHIYRRGVAPEDGFTCYVAFVGDNSRGCRWGDYSEANLGTDGNFYFETEYITPRLHRARQLGHRHRGPTRPPLATDDPKGPGRMGPAPCYPCGWSAGSSVKAPPQRGRIDRKWRSSSVSNRVVLAVAAMTATDALAKPMRSSP
jgi:hypothetical protein